MSLIYFVSYDKNGHTKDCKLLNADDISDFVNPTVDKELEARQESESKRDYLGASIIGEKCLRKIQYTWKHKDENIPAKTVRIFDIGHLLEDQVAAWLNESGFILQTKNDKGRQFGFSVADGEIAGHIDGIIKHIPEKILKQINKKLKIENKKLIEKECDVLWECKTLNSTSWKDTKKHGIYTSKPAYYSQVQLYMAYLNFDYTFFTALNKDTAELYHELVPFNAEDAQQYSDKAVNLLIAKKHNEEQPKISTDKNFYLCRMCGFKDICHKEGDTK